MVADSTALGCPLTAGTAAHSVPMGQRTAGASRDHATLEAASGNGSQPEVGAL